jgi:hypothetical protein
MQIFTKLLNNSTITLDVEPSDNIIGVKGKIQVQTGLVPGPTWALTFNGIVLDNNQTLSNYNIQKNDMLHIISTASAGLVLAGAISVLGGTTITSA